jgi:hypothetical protein
MSNQSLIAKSGAYSLRTHVGFEMNKGRDELRAQLKRGTTSHWYRHRTGSMENDENE